MNEDKIVSVMTGHPGTVIHDGDKPMTLEWWELVVSKIDVPTYIELNAKGRIKRDGKRLWIKCTKWLLDPSR